VLEPTEIIGLANAKVFKVAAGESHSAAITSNGKLYTWGNGVYGRLGTGFDTNELKPKLVEDLTKSVISVSCGTFHTVVLSTDGKMFTFG
jgi:alpha-tubulin suppressor-like RCC1 family protein